MSGKFTLGGLVKEAISELATEKKDFAKNVLKSRIREIEKAERVLLNLKNQYQGLLSKSVDEVFDEGENGNIRF
jgi:hypothetical protein